MKLHSRAGPRATGRLAAGGAGALLSALWSTLMSALPLPAAAQGTWMQTQCLVAAGSTGPCKAAPGWGQTGLDHVQALAAAAGPGNLGQSLAKPETLPAGNAARAQVAAVMLGFLDSDRPSGTYRWFGPVAPPSPQRPGTPLAATAAAASGPYLSAVTSAVPSASTSATPSAAGNSASPAISVQATWLAGALGEEPQARSASWWLTGPFAGPTMPPEANAGADRYRVLRFLAAQCPQLEGKIAPNAWTLCTNRSVAEPAAISLVLLSLVLAGAASVFGARCSLRRQPGGAGPLN